MLKRLLQVPSVGSQVLPSVGSQVLPVTMASVPVSKYKGMVLSKKLLIREGPREKLSRYGTRPVIAHPQGATSVCTVLLHVGVQNSNCV